MKAIDYICRRVEADAAETSAIHSLGSFHDFLRQLSRVKDGARYVPYHFTGREALAQIVARIDSILDSANHPPLPDASLAICGGAQFGKTVLMLNLLAYLTAVRFRNVGYYLPDDDLVQGIVDGKLRPDVLDQIPAVSRLIQLGRTLNVSGRAVNRKGALLVTDGQRTALAYVRGMGKVPTTFSMDVVVQDEKDDITEYNAKFLQGRMTASDLRFSLSIGTQRYHGAGQNREFEDGTQHVGLLFPADGASDGLNPEEHWPQVCRLSRSGAPAADDPQLTPEGDFASAQTGQRCSVTAMHEPGARVYLADPVSGAPFDRRSVRFVARRPDRELQRKWSYRVSQLIVDAIDLRQIVAAWAEAVRDPDRMTAFCTDRLALPRSFAQGLDPAALQCARSVEPYTVTLAAPQRPAPSYARFAGLDMGDRCWLAVVEAKSGEGAAESDPARLVWAEMLSAERVRERVPELCAALGVKTLCVDAGPLRDLSRDLCFVLSRGSDQHWDESAGRWRGLRAAAVEFTLREGQGLRQKAGQTQDGTVYPLLACHREETIGRVIAALQPPTPRLLLPERSAQTPPILATYEQHLLSGSRQERQPDGKAMHYVDKCENHFLLATAYAALARQVDARESASVTPGFARVRTGSGGKARMMEG